MEICHDRAFVEFLCIRLCSGMSSSGVYGLCAVYLVYGIAMEGKDEFRDEPKGKSYGGERGLMQSWCIFLVIIFD